MYCLLVERGEIVMPSDFTHMAALLLRHPNEPAHHDVCLGAATPPVMRVPQRREQLLVCAVTVRRDESLPQPLVCRQHMPPPISSAVIAAAARRLQRAVGVRQQPQHCHLLH